VIPYVTVELSTEIIRYPVRHGDGAVREHVLEIFLLPDRILRLRIVYSSRAGHDVCWPNPEIFDCSSLEELRDILRAYNPCKYLWDPGWTEAADKFTRIEMKIYTRFRRARVLLLKKARRKLRSVPAYPSGASRPPRPLNGQVSDSLNRASSRP